MADSAVSSDVPEPLFRFGVVTDVQYADIADGTSFGGTPRFYRNSLLNLRCAALSCLDATVSRPCHREVVADWRTRSGLVCALHLGDILDSFCPREESVDALRRVITTFDGLQQPVYHTLGNHCLANLPRPVLNAALGISGDGAGSSYYTAVLHPGFRLVMLDCFDLSVLGWPPGHPHHEAAVALLASNNPNANKNSPETLEGLQRRFVAFGGGVSDAQLAWLDATLAQADAAGERVFVCGHLPCHPEAAASVCLMWNYSEVLDILHAHPCVVATFAGHTHREGYHQDERGIHHRVLAAVLECPPGTNAYAHVDVWHDGAHLHGSGSVGSTPMPFRVLAPV